MVFWKVRYNPLSVHNPAYRVFFLWNETPGQRLSALWPCTMVCMIRSPHYSLFLFFLSESPGVLKFDCICLLYLLCEARVIHSLVCNSQPTYVSWYNLLPTSVSWYNLCTLYPWIPPCHFFTCVHVT